jgi:hypothetical protein
MHPSHPDYIAFFFGSQFILVPYDKFCGCWKSDKGTHLDSNDVDMLLRAACAVAGDEGISIQGLAIEGGGVAATLKELNKSIKEYEAGEDDG